MAGKESPPTTRGKGDCVFCLLKERDPEDNTISTCISPQEDYMEKSSPIRGALLPAFTYNSSLFCSLSPTTYNLRTTAQRQSQSYWETNSEAKHKNVF